VLRAIFAVIGIALLIAGVTVAENWRGSARRLALWAVRPNNRVIQGRGLYRLRNVGFQTVAHRFYGGAAAFLGFVILVIAVRH
jgi:hypothetical protein